MGGSAWEFGVTAGGLRVDESFMLGSEAGWTSTLGARLARRLGSLAALGAEAWRGSIDRGGDGRTLWSAGTHLRVTPWAGRGWPIDPALHFGVEWLTVDDDEERGPAFVAGAGVARIAPGWTFGLAVRTHHLSVRGPSVGEPPVATSHDSDMWEVRADLAIALGGGGG